MKRWVIAVGIGLVAAVAVQFLTGFASDCGEIREQVLRLHILANSDSAEDQALKLAVRDRILEESGVLFERTDSKEEAIRAMDGKLDEIQRIAEDEVRRHGCDDPVRVERTRMFFDTRVYEDFTLPAGQYDAVRVTIGEAEGHNWWCVLYPMLCLPAAQPQEELEAAFPEDQAEIIEHAGEFQVEFAAVEWIEKIKDWLAG